MSGAPITRRALLTAGLAMAGMGWLSRLPAIAAPNDHAFVTPRAEWDGDLLPTGPLESEAPGDVRFLLVHHSASPNSYAASDVPGLLRSFYRHHTDAKGWPDVAYNFFVDRYGGVWEGRTGSLDAPVKGDATGGSQGHALLVCLVGDHTSETPTDAAVTSPSASWRASLAYRLVAEQLPALVLAASTARGTPQQGVPEAREPESTAPAPAGEVGDAEAVVEHPGRPRAEQPVPPPPQPGLIDARPPRPSSTPAAVAPAVTAAPAADGPSLLPLVTGVAGAALTAAGSGAHLHRRRRPNADSWSSACVPPPSISDAVPHFEGDEPRGR